MRQRAEITFVRDGGSPLVRRCSELMLMACLAWSLPGDARAEAMPPANSETKPTRPSLIDPEDGWLDVSQFVDQSYGFVPVVMPITEPAIGYGVAGGLVFIDKPEQNGAAGFQRPNMTIVGGMGTENGSRGVAAADVRYWLDDRLQTVAAIGYAPLNLKFYGVGDGPLNDHPLDYSLAPLGGKLGAKYRLSEQSRWWVGLGYQFASTKVKFDVPASVPGGVFPSSDEMRTGGLTPSVSFDSRNNVFTPTKGVFVEVSSGFYSEALGGDTEFQKPAAVAIAYLPLQPRLTLGLRSDVSASFGDTPFYARPFVSMRGVGAMRYQGEEVAQAEAELRWQFWKRFSVVGFGGVGSAWNDLERFKNSQTVTTCGTGFRYELARKYGLHMGFDVAFGPDAPVFYLQFGSAWMRP